MNSTCYLDDFFVFCYFYFYLLLVNGYWSKEAYYYDKNDKFKLDLQNFMLQLIYIDKL